MIIKLLQDNTVYASYSDGGVETINSTHSHKALSPLTKKIADALPYKGAMEFNAKNGISFSTSSALVSLGDRTLNPDDDITEESADVQTFCNIVWDNGGRTLWEAKQNLAAIQAAGETENAEA